LDQLKREMDEKASIYLFYLPRLDQLKREMDEKASIYLFYLSRLDQLKREMDEKAAAFEQEKKSWEQIHNITIGKGSRPKKL
jgi:hypothetical protein